VSGVGNAGSSAVVPVDAPTWPDRGADSDGRFELNSFGRSRTEPLPGTRLAGCGGL